MFLIPCIWYIVFCYVPMYGIQLAFRNYNPRLGYLGSPWVGLRYFNQFFSSYYNLDIIWNTVSISLYSIIFGFPIPILLAIILNELPGERFKKVLQNLTYIPHFISVVVLCGMLYLFLSPQYGVLNTFLNFLGFESVGFLESNKYFKAVYVLSDIWQESGWNSVIYIAALAGIDPELYEAARIDGAGELKTFNTVVFPMIKPGVGALAIFTFIQSWNDYFMQLIMLSSTKNLTISLGIAKMQAENSTDYGLIMAGAAFASVPIIIVFIIFQKYFTKGITMGAVKG